MQTICQRLMVPAASVNPWGPLQHQHPQHLRHSNSTTPWHPTQQPQQQMPHKRTAGNTTPTLHLLSKQEGLLVHPTHPWGSIHMSQQQQTTPSLLAAQLAAV
jgi:hypothetical protein